MTRAAFTALAVLWPPLSWVAHHAFEARRRFALHLFCRRDRRTNPERTR